MSIEKIALNFFVKNGKSEIVRSLLCHTQAIKPSSSKGIKYAPQIESDTFVRTTEKAMPKNLANILEGLNPNLNEDTIKFLKNLYQTGEEKFDYIYNTFIGELKNCYYIDGEPFIKAIKEMPAEEIKNTFEEIKNLYKTLPQKSYFEYFNKKEQIPDIDIFMKLTTLKTHNKQAYEYIIISQDKEEILKLLTKFRVFGSSTFETLTMPQIRQIRLTVKKGESWANLTKGEASEEMYIEDSDDFYKSLENVRDLHRHLSTDKITEPITAFRAELDTGIFSSVLLDKDMVSKVRRYISENITKAKNTEVHDYTGKIREDEKTDLFSFIMKKKVLSLADAMQVAKYGDKKFLTQIIDLMKKTKIQDTRFKSFTFDKGFMNDWISDAPGQNTKIIHNAQIKRGLHGHFTRFAYPQSEFILDNEAKIITSQNIKYDPLNDIFYVDSTIKRV